MALLHKSTTWRSRRGCRPNYVRHRGGTARSVSSLRTSLRLSHVDNLPLSACHASANITGCGQDASYGAESSVPHSRHSATPVLYHLQRHNVIGIIVAAGAARELAKGSPTAAVVAVETRRFAEGNGLSRLIGLRVAVVATPVAYGSGDTRSDAAPQRRRSSGDTRSDAAW